jgi:hypothetical protein
VLQALRQFRHVAQGSRLLGKADKLEARGKLPEARVALLDALEAVQDVEGDMPRAVASSVRLPVVTGLARIAATLGDQVEGVGYARMGLALWSEFRLGVPNARDLETFARWESWARAYLEAVPTAKPEATMKLDYVAGVPERGALVRLWGCDGAVVQALRRSLKGLSRGPLVLHAIPGIGMVNDCHVTAVLADRGRGPRRIGPTSFLWEEDGVGWERVAGLLEPFESLKPSEAKFQFLSQGGDVAMLISTDGRW